MEFVTGVAVGVLGFAAWRALTRTAVKGGLVAADHTRAVAGAVKDHVADVVDQTRDDQDPAAKTIAKPKKTAA